MQNSRLKFYVEDTGIGIPTERQKAVFERFVQADIEDSDAYAGSGIGLSITKSYVNMLGGEIWLESSAGKGSVFYFTLPYTPGKLKTMKPNTLNKISLKEKLNVLIADDDTVSSEFLQEALRPLAKNIYTAKNGIEAIDIYKRQNHIDIILMDIKMPEMSGYTATEKIREFDKEVIIIAKTAYALPGDEQKASEAGCNGYISKPIEQEKLLDLIQKYIDK